MSDSENNTKKPVNLDALRIDESAASARVRRRVGPRFMLTGFILVLAGTAASFLIPILRPATPVRTAAVRAAGEGSGAARAFLAEAAGWIEPDPFAVEVRPLVRGILEELLVLEGTPVKRGETVVGRMRSAEREAARDRAAALVAQRKSLVAKARVDLDVARSLLAQKGELRGDVVSAKRACTMLRGRLAESESETNAARAAVRSREAELTAQERLKEAGGSYAVALEKAQAARTAAAATLNAKQHEHDRLAAELKDAEQSLAIAEELLAAPRDLEGAVNRAEAEVVRCGADLEAANTDLEIAERELGYCRIVAPMDGVVMRLEAAPGTEVGGNAHAVVSLYDPKKLQARVDVPLASLGAVFVGQEVEVRSETVRGKLVRGVVSRIQHESDLTKNTTQVKVRLIDPDPLLRPETLCRARFLADKEETDGDRGPALFRVPSSAVRDGAVFVVDVSGAKRARRVPVEHVGDADGDWIVRGALSVTQRVILDVVEDGDHVKELQR
ncbi:MAG: efflux RND transporter periplasmic adaptor subunit [Planctomycetota bacterium]